MSSLTTRLPMWVSIRMETMAWPSGALAVPAAFTVASPAVVATVDKPCRPTPSHLAMKTSRTARFHNDDRPPLLIIGNEKDHTVPASVSREAAKRLGKSTAVVDYKEYTGRPHFTAGAAG